MKITIKKIFIVVVLVLGSIAAVVYFANEWRNDEYFEKISITGNYTISKEDILTVARIKEDSSINIQELNIDLIQDRISKHPEIKKVFVSKEPPAELKIQIIEKNPIAVVNTGEGLKLIDDELEIFPFNNFEKMFDLPVISGLKSDPSDMKQDKFNKEDLRTAIFLITNARREGKSLHYQISEVNMSDPEKIIVYSNERAIPFYFPRPKGLSISDAAYQEDLKEKLDVFQEFTDKVLGDSETEAFAYVDLRFSNQVVVNYKRNLTTSTTSGEENESQKEEI